ELPRAARLQLLTLVRAGRRPAVRSDRLTAACRPRRAVPRRQRPTLFVAERFDRIEARGADGRDHAEEDADARREADADGERPPRQRDGEPGEQVYGKPDERSEADAEQAAGRREENRLEQELPQDLHAPGAERLADADLARPLGDADRHDAHDA